MNGKKVTSKMISRMSKQSLRSSRMRNVFVMITIVLASALLTAILMFAAGQKQQEKHALSHGPQVIYGNLSEEQTEKLEQDARIAYRLQVKKGFLSEMEGFDVMPSYVSELSDEIRVGERESGRLPESENEIAVYDVMLRKMGITPVVGARVTLSFYDGSTEEFTVSGILKGEDTAKQFSVFFSEGYAKNGSQLKDAPYEVYAKLYGAAEMNPEACKEVMYSIGSDAGIEREYVNPSKAFLDSLSFDMQSVMIYGLVGTVILFACILVIYGVFYLSVIGRIHQFGQLRTVGMTKKQIKRFVSREGGLLFVRAAPVGVLIGVAAGYFILPGGFDLSNTLLAAVFVLAVVYAVTMFSVRKPARLAAAVSPMEALRYMPRESMKKTTARKTCRKLTPFGLGMMNFSRHRKKTTITMFSLALGGILFMTAATYMSSFNKMNYARQGHFKYAEFHIRYAGSMIELNENGLGGLQAKMPIDDEIIREIAALDGVKEVEEIRGFGVRYDYPKNGEYGKTDMVRPLTEDEGKEIHKYLEEGSDDYDKLMSGDYILVADNDTVEEIFGWKFLVGDRVVLHYYDGSKMAEKSVTILGILNDRYVIDQEGLVEGWFLMPEAAILRLLSYDSLNSDLLVSTEADREEEVGEALARMIAEKPELLLETLAERRITYEQMANQQFGVISGLSLFIMTFSILSMMNTLITNIVTRKQELAMLESIGMSKGQIRKMLLDESLFFVLVTVGVTMTVGTACGYVLSFILYNKGAFYMAFRFPAVFALAYVGVLLFVPLVIILVSMRGFSRETLVERLRGMEN
ncbi:MAG: ABC transporter permease [Lachnospiraceae bacterium]|nr:ABC transporter permease [Lachnospiraceae bacterium]